MYSLKKTPLGNPNGQSNRAVGGQVSYQITQAGDAHPTEVLHLAPRRLATLLLLFERYADFRRALLELHCVAICVSGGVDQLTCEFNVTFVVDNDLGDRVHGLALPIERSPMLTVEFMVPRLLVPAFGSHQRARIVGRGLPAHPFDPLVTPVALRGSPDISMT